VLAGLSSRSGLSAQGDAGDHTGGDGQGRYCPAPGLKRPAWSGK
jgi:hypothetical protein